MIRKPEKNQQIQGINYISCKRWKKHFKIKHLMQNTCETISNHLRKHPRDIDLQKIYQPLCCCKDLKIMVACLKHCYHCRTLPIVANCVKKQLLICNHWRCLPKIYLHWFLELGLEIKAPDRNLRKHKGFLKLLSECYLILEGGKNNWGRRMYHW